MIRQIRHSLGRYLAIFAIVALGVGFFAGLKVTRDAMVKTGENYFEELKMFDFRLVSTLGFTDDDVKKFEQLPFVNGCIGSVSADVLILKEDGADGVLHVHSLSDMMNVPDIVSGRLPEAEDECVVDNKYYDEGMLGKYIELSKNNEASVRDTFAFDRYKVVGVINSPYYINFERGSSSLGSVSGFMYISKGGFTTDYYTEIFLRLSERYEIYSGEYDNYSAECEKKITPVLEECAAERYERLKSDAIDKIHSAEEELADGRKEYESKKSDTEGKLIEAEAKIAEGEKELLGAQEKLDAGAEQLNDAFSRFEASKIYMDTETAEQQAAVLEGMKTELDTGAEQLAESKLQLETARAELEENKKTAAEEFLKAERELTDAQSQIDEAYLKLEDINEPSSFVLGRNTNIGYACLENDTGIVSGISKVFPLFFFIVASLVCVTTMTRMVDEQRVQNGILKALGYSDPVIVGQYLFYAGSASVFGCITGFLIGSQYMPMVLWKIYHIMYSIERPVVYLLDWKLFAFCAILYLIATLGATWIAASGDLKEAAAELIRPKSPTAGKRVLLERIGFIWKRVKFLHKVSIRNILRYKKRMFMMIIGVGGCTALLLTGFGIRDSIQPILDYQYNEIHLYDISVMYLDEVTPEEQQNIAETYSDAVAGIKFIHSESTDLVTNDSSDSVTLVVADDIGSEYVSLHNGDEVYGWPGKGEVIIDYRLATANDIEIGDTIEFRDSDFNTVKVKVSGIFDNYIYDFAYISSETYEEQTGKAPVQDTAYVLVKEGTAPAEAAAAFLKDENCGSVSIIENQLKNVGNMLSSLDYVVLIVLVCAGALAFIVIYNLTNISINERIREIATIKVLGFYESESAAYVFRENLVLTFISAIVGLPMGVALHRYVMSQIKIKSMYFGHRILPISFVWALILTLVFAVIVDFFMYFRLKKINMAESLKAIE